MDFQLSSRLPTYVCKFNEFMILLNLLSHAPTWCRFTEATSDFWQQQENERESDSCSFISGDELIKKMLKKHPVASKRRQSNL